MSENAIASESISKPAPDTAKPKGARKPTKKANPAKKPSRAKKAAAKPKTDRTNKKAEVIAMMKRAKGAAAINAHARIPSQTIYRQIPALLSTEKCKDWTEVSSAIGTGFGSRKNTEGHKVAPMALRCALHQ